MVDLPSRRAVLRTTAEFGLTGISLRGYATIARAQKPTGLSAGPLHRIDAALRAATTAEQVPGVVALAASDHGIEYEGVFGKRQRQGPAMTRDGDLAPRQARCTAASFRSRQPNTPASSSRS
jgi:hypothetical protein